MQASSGEQQVDSTSGSDQDIHSVPDAELLKFQKQRSTPKVAVDEVGHDGETNVCEVDDFGLMSGGAQMGMMPAGTEESVIRQLHHAGSLDASSILPDV